MSDKFMFIGEEDIEVKNETKISSNSHIDDSTKIFNISKYKDVTEVVDELKNNISVIINLESLTASEELINEAKRVMDYICGAAYALNYKVLKINRTTFTLSKIN